MANSHSDSVCQNSLQSLGAASFFWGALCLPYVVAEADHGSRLRQRVDGPASTLVAPVLRAPPPVGALCASQPRTVDLETRLLCQQDLWSTCEYITAQTLLAIEKRVGTDRSDSLGLCQPRMLAKMSEHHGESQHKTSNNTNRPVPVHHRLPARESPTRKAPGRPCPRNSPTPPPPRLATIVVAGRAAPL